MLAHTDIVKISFAIGTADGGCLCIDGARTAPIRIGWVQPYILYGFLPVNSIEYQLIQISEYSLALISLRAAICLMASLGLARLRCIVDG